MSGSLFGGFAVATGATAMLFGAVPALHDGPFGFPNGDGPPACTVVADTPSQAANSITYGYSITCDHAPPNESIDIKVTLKRDGHEVEHHSFGVRSAADQRSFAATCKGSAPGDFTTTVTWSEGQAPASVITGSSFPGQC